MKPSTARTLDALRRRGAEGLTALTALDIVGTFRLGARVWELKTSGHDIETQWETTPHGARIARYVLHEGQKELGL